MTTRRYVYITGCDTGFGALAVGMFEKKGFHVFAGCYLPASMDKLKSPMCVPLQVDVRNEASVLNAAAQIKERLQAENAELYALVNNAGILVQPCPPEWQSLKDFRDMMEVNVFGTVAVTNSVLPLIRKSKGRVVCTASIAGRIGIPTEAAYCASKYAVEAYADVLRRDMYAWGVTVHIIEPGVFPNTGLYDRFQTGLDHVWDRLDPALKADYGEDHKNFVRKLLGFSLKEFGTTDSTLVPKAYVAAVCDEKPHYRYRVGWDSKYLISFVEKLHEASQDTILTVSDPRLPFVPPAAAPKDGMAVAWGRYDKGWKRFIAVLLVVAFITYRMRL